MLSDKTLRLVPEPQVLPDYLALALRLPDARRQMRVMATGTGGAMKNLSQAKLEQLLIRRPDAQTQLRAVELHATALDAARALSERQQETSVLKRVVLSSVLSST